MHENSNGQIRKWHLTSSLTSSNPLTLISCSLDPQLPDLISFLILNQNLWFKAHFKDLMARNIMQVVKHQMIHHTVRNLSTKITKIILNTDFQNFMLCNMLHKQLNLHIKPNFWPANHAYKSSISSNTS